MNDLHRHLSDQADALLLPAGDVHAVSSRAQRRRTRRRLSAVAGLSAVALLAVSVAVRDGGDETVLDGVASPTVTASPLTWSVTATDAGLAYERWSAPSAGFDGLRYRISTAPAGAEGDDRLLATLYQSADGVDWEVTPMPRGFRPSSVAAGGSTAYAIGTVPAGGSGQDLALARVDGSEPITLALPEDLAALAQAHPGVVQLTDLDVAALDDHRLLATATARALLDLPELLPEVPVNADWSITAEGVVVRPLDDPCADGADRAGACDEASREAGADPASGTAVVPPASATHGSTTTVVDGVDAEVDESLLGLHTWEDLGVPAELAALAVEPRAVLLGSDDGQSFTPIEVPVRAERLEVAGIDGTFHLLAASVDGATVLSSEDGRTWRELGVLSGSVSSLDEMGGQPLVVSWEDGGVRVLRHVSGHGFVELDLLAAIEDGSTFLGEVAVGPLGIAGLAYPKEGEGATLLFSPDGTSVSATPIDEVVSDPLSVLGLHVTADAVFVRGYDPDEATGSSTIAPQVVLVGTP